MKRLNLIVLGLLTLSLMILTEKLNLSDSSDKLLCTILWLGWLISAITIYLFNTQNYRFRHEVHGGYVVGFAIAFENQLGDKVITIVLPVISLEFKWIKQVDHGA
tara:strand:- start:1481 stop:1795 length:315 start_codon:yes stop_codon:yes gene_type:complete